MGLHERIQEEGAWRKGPGIAEGADVEHAVFGSLHMPAGKKVEYMPFGQALFFAKQNQPPILSRSKLVSTLRGMVAEKVGNKTAPIEFYTAVGSPLDLYHGVDGFFEQDGNIVTCDISLREKENLKADVLIVATMDSAGVVHISDTELQHAATSIAAAFARSTQKRAA